MADLGGKGQSSSSTSSSPQPLPTVAGFVMTIMGSITNYEVYDTRNDSYVKTDYENLADLILRKGADCKSSLLRCDVQGDTTSSDVNTQCQIGGTDLNYKRKKFKGRLESTSFTCVLVSTAAYSHRSINLALVRAHEYSNINRVMVKIDLAAVTTAMTTPIVNNNNTYQTITCQACNDTTTLYGYSARYCHGCGNPI